jgi:N-acetylmuramoyl-L-alanine amidase
MAYSDRELLARIIKCEAGGEGDNGLSSPSCHRLNSVKKS